MGPHGRTLTLIDPSGNCVQLHERAGRGERPGPARHHRQDFRRRAPKLWFVHADHLNRPVMMTDGAKIKVWEAVWWPYGEAWSITGTASLDLRLPGQWFQAESGLHYNWHRTYDPKSGRYLQPDPLGMPDGPNRWWYAKNSPLMYADPEGQFVPILVGIGIGLAIDFAVSEIKTMCGCASSDSSIGASGYGAVGGGIGLFGPFEQKPRTGISGGGRSGTKTSVFSRFLYDLNPGRSGGALRQFGRVAIRGNVLIGAGALLYDIYDVGKCVLSK